MVNYVLLSRIGIENTAELVIFIHNAIYAHLPFIIYRSPFTILFFLCLFILSGCSPPPSPTPWPTRTSISTSTSASASASISTKTIVKTVATRQPTSAATVTPALQATAILPSATLTVWDALPPPQAKQLGQEIQQFQAQYPTYHIVLTHYDNPDALLTNILSGEAEFDLILASPILLGDLLEAEQLAPMSDFFSTAFLDNFAGVTLQGASKDKTLWGLPDTTGFHLLLFYNRALLDQPPTTMSEVLATSAEIASTSNGDKWGLGFNSYDPLWLIPWLATYNGWLVDETGQPTLNSLAMVAALTDYNQWHQSVGVLPATSYDSMRIEFVNGNLALMIDGEWAVSELGRAKNLDWGVTTLPHTGDTGIQPAAPLVLSRYWTVNRTMSGNKSQAVVSFLEHVTRPERQLVWLESFQALPTHRTALDSSTVLSNPIWRISRQQMLRGHGIMAGVNPNQLLGAMRTPLIQMLEGTLTPEEAAMMMQERME
ncbi:extracellular solute-binding protein [Anaerolineales bacterium HSG24]|nr:extracellular solute-binding protein [Anaerolineales bacterium HSG24]